MKKILIVLIMFSLNSFGQEMEFKTSDKWVDFGIWQIPNAVDTSMYQDEWKTFVINDSIVNNYFKAHPELLWREKVINDSTIWNNRHKYRWVVYENLARQVQNLVRERIRVVKEIPEAEKSANIQYAKIIQFLNAGYSPDEIRHYIDSVYIN